MTNFSEEDYARFREKDLRKTPEEQKDLRSQKGMTNFNEEDYARFREKYLRKTPEEQKDLRSQLINYIYETIRDIAKNNIKSKVTTPTSVTNTVFCQFFELTIRDPIEDCATLEHLKKRILKMIYHSMIDKYRRDKTFREHIERLGTFKNENDYDVETYLQNIGEASYDEFIYDIGNTLQKLLEKYLTREEIFLVLVLKHEDGLKYSEMRPYLEGEPSEDAIGQRYRKILAKLSKIPEIQDLKLLYDSLGE